MKITDRQAAQRIFQLVILRLTPAELRPEKLEAAAKLAWTQRFGVNDDGSNYVSSGAPHFLYVLQAHGNAFTVTAVDSRERKMPPPTTYIPESAAAVWSEYKCDIAVGVAHNFDTDPVRLAAFVSTLAASLCDDQSIGLYHPATQRLWNLDDVVRAKLGEGARSFFG